MSLVRWSERIVHAKNRYQRDCCIRSIVEKESLLSLSLGLPAVGRSQISAHLSNRGGDELEGLPRAEAALLEAREAEAAVEGAPAGEGEVAWLNARRSSCRSVV